MYKLTIHLTNMHTSKITYLENWLLYNKINTIILINVHIIIKISYYYNIILSIDYYTFLM